MVWPNDDGKSVSLCSFQTFFVVVGIVAHRCMGIFINHLLPPKPKVFKVFLFFEASAFLRVPGFLKRGSSG